VFIVALSDETTAITTGDAKGTFRVPFTFKPEAIRAELATASTSGAVTIDIRESGTTVFGTKLTVDQDELTSVTAVAATLVDEYWAENAELKFDIDGAGTGAKGLKIMIYGYRII
jgi:hypothetical protein